MDYYIKMIKKLLLYYYYKWLENFRKLPEDMVEFRFRFLSLQWKITVKGVPQNRYFLFPCCKTEWGAQSGSASGGAQSQTGGAVAPLPP
jgi:hypothetical protein